IGNGATDAVRRVFWKSRQAATPWRNLAVAPGLARAGFAAALTRLREAAGLTQRDLAERAGRIRRAGFPVVARQGNAIQTVRGVAKSRRREADDEKPVRVPRPAAWVRYDERRPAHCRRSSSDDASPELHDDAAVHRPGPPATPFRAQRVHGGPDCGCDERRLRSNRVRYGPPPS